MDKKTFIAASIASLILALLVGMQAIRVAEANPTVWNSTEPVKDPPLITVQSPQNTTYLQSEILLNFTIAKPVSWRDLNSMEQMREISYTFDGEQHTLWAGKTYSMPKDTYFTSYTFPSAQQFFLVLNVSNGQHLLQISAFGVSTYLGDIVPWAAYYPLNTSKTIAFSVYGAVSTSPSSTPLQTLTLSPTDTSASPIIKGSPTPSPSLCPSPSATPLPKPEVSLTSKKTEYNFTSLAIAVGLVIAAAVAGLIVYFGKRR